MCTLLMIASYPKSIVSFRGDLICSLIKKGVTVHVAVPDIDECYKDKEALENLGVKVHQIPLSRTGMNPISDLRTFVTLLSLLRRIRPEIVFSYTIKPVIYGLLAAWLTRVPRRIALITGLGYWFNTDASTSKAWLALSVRTLYTRALSVANTVIFQNKDDLDLLKKLGVLKGRSNAFVVNGSGVDLDFYRPTPFPASVSFLLIARLLGAKGVREYVEAAKRIQQKHPHVLFRLVGWQEAAPDAISSTEITQWVEGGIIEFIGRLDDVRPAIADSSVYVLPSYREGMPRTVLEAMAMGRPVITTNAAGCRDTVNPGENGFLVPVGDINELVVCMERFILRPELCNEMGQKGRVLAENKFNVHKINQMMIGEMGL